MNSNTSRGTLFFVLLLAVTGFSCSQQDTQTKFQKFDSMLFSEAPFFWLGQQLEKSPQMTAQELFERIAQGLNISQRQCPEKVWPGFDFKKINVLFLTDTTPTYAFYGSTGKLEIIDESLVPTGSRQGLYSFTQWQGENTVTLYLNSANLNIFLQLPDKALALVVHEAFHAYGQKEWRYVLTGQRGTIYPVSSTPRLQRRLLFESLNSGLARKPSGTSDLRAASYWYNKWKSDFKSEYQSTTDSYEGTARYVDRMSLAVATIGCEASNEQLAAYFQEKSQELKGYLDPSEFSLDSEGYAIGSLATFALWLEDSDFNWVQKIREGATPPDVLFSAIEPLSQEAPEETAQIYKKSEIQINAKIAVWMEPEIKKLIDYEQVRLSFPSQSSHGSYSTNGFFLYQSGALGSVTFIPFAREYNFEASNWKVQAQPTRVFVDFLSNPCQSNLFTTLVHASELVIDENTLRLFLPDLHGSMLIEEKTDSFGYRWLCGK